MPNSNDGDQVAASVAAAETSDGDPSKAEMEAEFRADDKELCDAVKKIQSTFRLKRKDDVAEAAQAVASSVEPATAEATSPAKADELSDELADIDLADPDLAKAASKIQAKFRFKRN